MAVLTFVMFTAWALVKSFIERPPGDYETEVCDIRLKDKEYDKALKAANTALQKTLTNESFTARAPAEVVEKKRQRLATAQKETADARAQLEKLGE